MIAAPDGYTFVRVAVDDGTILCRYRAGSSRPVVFVAGWGAEYSTFGGLEKGLDRGVTLAFLETREKRSCEIARDASFTMLRFARDLSAAICAIGFKDGEYVLAGTCFGSAVCIEALARDLVRPAVTLLFDPMPRMWVPRWVLAATPLLPVRFIYSVRPLVRSLLLHGMQEQAQRDRTRSIIDGADLWKWKRGSYALRDWSAFGVAPSIRSEVHVLNGSSDRFHSADHYPRVAAVIPGATFLGFSVDESEREQFMGRVVSAYGQAVGSSVPDALRESATRIIGPGAVKSPGEVCLSEEVVV